MAQKTEKAKETKKSKKENKPMRKTIILTVATTLAILAVIGALLFIGFNYGRSYEKNINNRVTSEAKALVQVSKQ